MNIYFIGDYKDSYNKDSAVLVTAGLFETLLRKGIPVKYITYFREGSKYSRYQKLFSSEQIDTNSFRFGLFPMLIYVFRHRPDIIYLLNLEFFTVPIILLKFILRYKIIYIAHGLNIYEITHFKKFPYFLNLKNKIAEYLNFKIADTIIALSVKTSRLITYCYKLNPAKIRILNNGITLNLSIRKEIKDNKSALLKIATVGSTVRKEKGIDFLLEALCSTGYKIELNVFGEKSDSVKTINKNLVTMNCYPVMEKEKMFEEIIKNDIFVSASSYEHFNLSLLEAMNLGMLFISSDRVGLTERFDSSLLKFVYRYNDRKEFIEKLNMVVNLPLEDKIYFSSLNIKFSRDYSWDKISEQYISLFYESR
jgi:glycosyltransferase involved in cell wall biosynthesis